MAVTLLLVDVSRYQVERTDPLDLATARAAGFGAVNLALDRGKATDVLSEWVRTYADRARALGMGISTYRWLDNRLPGAESAQRAYARMVTLGGPTGMAHVVDCEDNASEGQLRDYCVTMAELLGRPIAIYTGRWWMQPRGWRIRDMAPFLWAAPGAGYLAGYPGDGSPHWAADYGGHTALDVMQYAVTLLPGTGACSLSAIRDPAVWSALTGGTSPVTAYQEWINAGKPVSGTVRPLAKLATRLRSYGYIVYGIGDQSHLTHNPPEDHTPFAATGWPVSAPRWWLHAIDVMPPAASKGLPSLQQLGAQIVADRRAGHPEVSWLKYINWESERNNGGPCHQDRWMPNYERRTSSDRGHIHISARSDMRDSTVADNYDPVARLRGVTAQPAAPTRKARPMLIGQHKRPDGTVNPAVWFGNGIEYRHVTTPPARDKLLAAGAVHLGTFENESDMLDVLGRRPAYAPPATLLTLTPEQVTALAAAIAEADNGLPADPQVIEAAVRRAVTELTPGAVQQALREGTGPRAG